MKQEEGTRALYFVVQGLFERADSIGQDLANQFRALSRAGVRCRVFAGVHRPGLYADLPVESSNDLAGVLRVNPAPVLYHWCDGWRAMDDLLAVASVPVILRWHNNTPPWFFAPYSLEATARTLRGFSSILELARAPHVSLMTNSSFSARQLAALGVSPAKVSIVHPLSDYLSASSTHRGARQVSVGKLRLLFAGRVVPHKGQKHVIQAAHVFQSAYAQRCRLVFPGRPDGAMPGYLRELESLAAELGVEASWPGEVTAEELEALYERSDVFVCLSEHEGFGLPVIEAMKAGLPVIGYRCSAVAETLRDHPLACDQLDYEEIAARLFCLTDPTVSDAVVRFQDEAVLPRFLPRKTLNQLFVSLNGTVADLRPDAEDEVLAVPADSAASIAAALARHRKHLRPSAQRTADAAEGEPPERYVTLNDIRAYQALLTAANKVAGTGNLRDDWMGTPFRSPMPLIGRLIDRYKRLVLYSQDGLVVGQTKLHASTLARLDEIEAKVDRLSRRSVRSVTSQNGREQPQAIYDAQYFEGRGAKAHYEKYSEQALIPNGVIARDLFTLFSPRTALDVGCALGYLPRELRALSVQAYGIDVSRWAVERASLPYVRQANVAEEVLREKFDLVTAYDVLEHIPEERLEFVVSNLWDATARILVVVPAVYEEGVTHDFTDPSHVVFHPRPWWESLFRRCGVTLDEALADRLSATTHATTYNYAGRFLVGRKETRGSDTTAG